jgi:hypothetical protein
VRPGSLGASFCSVVIQRAFAEKRYGLEPCGRRTTRRKPEIPRRPATEPRKNAALPAPPTSSPSSVAAIGSADSSGTSLAIRQPRREGSLSGSPSVETIAPNPSHLTSKAPSRRASGLVRSGRAWAEGAAPQSPPTELTTQGKRSLGRPSSPRGLRESRRTNGPRLHAIRRGLGSGLVVWLGRKVPRSGGSFGLYTAARALPGETGRD